MSIRSVVAAAYRLIRLAGFDPLHARHLKQFPRYLRDRRRFSRQGGRIDKDYIILEDYDDASGSASGHYFHQDLLVAQRIFEANPAEHIDVGSRIDGFVAHVAAFRTIDVLDIRPLDNKAHPNIRFVQADLTNPIPELADRYPSVSCLHALEHFGLGRYSDPIDVNGHRRGFEAIASMVAAGGTLYVSVPVGRSRVEFNAHRVFAPDEPLSWAAGRFTLAGFDYVDDCGDLHRDASPEQAVELDYGCGIYTFVKAQSVTAALASPPTAACG